jgi:Family of unknown function (DUF6289)
MTRNKLTKSIAIVSLLATVGFSLQAIAGGYLRQYTYYSDAAKTNEVGTKIVSCSGQSTTSGTVTRYYTTEIEPCF